MLKCDILLHRLSLPPYRGRTSASATRLCVARDLRALALIIIIIIIIINININVDITCITYDCQYDYHDYLCLLEIYEPWRHRQKATRLLYYVI